MDDIYRTSCQLYDHQWEDGNPVRLLGITLQNLIAKEESYVQLDLFDYEKQPRRENLNRVMDGLRDKFGEGVILTAGMMSDDDPSALIRNHKVRGTSLQMDHCEIILFIKTQESEDHGSLFGLRRDFPIVGKRR
jgi:DNA polymerase-4